MGILVEAEFGELAKWMADKPGQLRQVKRRALDLAGFELAGLVAEVATKKFKSPTGRLAGAIRHQLEGDDTVKVGVMQGDDVLAYARIRDQGGTISGRPNLVFPLDNDASRRAGIFTPSGVSGVSAREVISDPAQFGLLGTFAKGRAILGVFDTGNRGPRGGKITEARAIFARVPSVTQRGNGYLTRTMAQEALPELNRQLAAALEEIGAE